MSANSLRATESDLGYLNRSWRALTGSCAADAATAERWYEVLASQYSGPGRYYHNLRHVAEVLRLIDEFEGDMSDHAAACFAAWFHDAVYDSRSKTNKEESAALSGRALAELGVATERVYSVRRLVLATRRHRMEDDVPDLGLFLDADLSILGAPEEVYAAYVEAIRKECLWVPDGAEAESPHDVPGARNDL